MSRAVFAPPEDRMRAVVVVVWLVRVALSVH